MTYPPALHKKSSTGHFIFFFRLFSVFTILFGFFHSNVDARSVPAFQGYVNDYANIISPSTEAKLTSIIHTFERSDSTQIAVLTIDSLEGDPLEDFSIRVVDNWEIGQKGKDNGILVLVAKQDRKIRIEVGRGLEGVLTDLLSGRIIDQVISPSFKTGRFDEGFEAGITALISASRGEFKADKRYRKRGRRSGDVPPIFSYIFFAFMITAFLGKVSKPLGAIAGAIILPLFVFFALPGALSFLLLLILFPAGAFGGLLLPFMLSGFFRGGGLHTGGGGFSGGGSGFGGFGGGGFGGGGASGGW